MLLLLELIHREECKKKVTCIYQAGIEGKTTRYCKKATRRSQTYFIDISTRQEDYHKEFGGMQIG